MHYKMFSVVCKCWNKVFCVCANFVTSSRKASIAERDLAEWRRIEHVDQYISKRP